MDQNINIQLTLKRISEVNFFLDPKFDWDLFDEDKLKIGLGFEWLPNIRPNILGFEIGVKYMMPNEDSLLLELGILLDIYINDINLFFDTNKKILSRDLAVNIINIGVGTLRGVLSTKVKGTFLENYPLPFISSSKIEEIIDNNTSND